MTSQQSLERLVAGWMADQPAVASDAELIDRVVATTGGQRPRPRWLALLLEAPMRTHARVTVGSPTRRMAFVVALLILGLLAAVGVGSLLLQRQPQTADWPGFRGGAGHDGTGGAGPIGNPIVQWTAGLGAPIRNNITVVAGLAIVPSEDGVLHAIRVADGLEQWTYLPGTSLAGPVGSADLVYVTDGRGILHGLDVTTGVVRWNGSGAVSAASPPTLSDGSILVGTSVGHVVAFDARTGVLRWDTAVSSASEIVSSPAAGGGLIYAASPTGGLVALRATTGQVAWRFDTGGDPGGDPAGTVVYADGIAYVGTPSDAPTGRLRAVDAATGQLRWVVDEPLFSPSVVGSLAISGSAHGVISARDVATGIERWRLQTGGVNQPPAIAGGIAFLAADTDRQILAIDVATGRILWRLPVDGGNQCCLAVARGLVFAGTMAGTVYAIGGDGQAIGPGQPSLVAPGSPAPSRPGGSASASAGQTASPPVVDPFAVTRRIEPNDLRLDQLLGLVVAPSGDIYVTDLSDHVTRLDRTGRFVSSWGGTGSAPGRFDFTPASTTENVHGSIGVGPDGSVYVSDLDNHRVQVFAPDGKPLRQFGSIGTGPGQFGLAYDLSADADGNVYVLDDGLRNLRKFSPTGSQIWTADGSTDPVLAGHGHTATLDSLGRVVLVNDDLGKVAYVDADGSVVDSFDAPGCDAPVDREGNVYVSGCGTALTQVFDAQHRLIGSSDIGIEFLRFGPEGEAVAISQDGAILFLTVNLPPS
jgi:outer membrane protein assembly factor BamB